MNNFQHEWRYGITGFHHSIYTVAIKQIIKLWCPFFNNTALNELTGINVKSILKPVFGSELNIAAKSLTYVLTTSNIEVSEISINKTLNTILFA